MSGNRELIVVGDHDPRKPMSEKTLNKAYEWWVMTRKWKSVGMDSGR